MDDADTPDIFKCPITNSKFKNAVLADDGRIYEKQAICNWFEKLKKDNKEIISPYDRQNIDDKLINCKFIEEIINSWDSLNKVIMDENRALKRELESLKIKHENIKKIVNE